MVIKTLYPDPDSLQMLDPDPNPQRWEKKMMKDKPNATEKHLENTKKKIYKKKSLSKEQTEYTSKISYEAKRPYI